MSAAGARHMAYIATLPCLLCRRGHAGGGRVEVHHVAEGSGKRDDFSTVPMCEQHHRGPAGLHGMGVRAFCALYRPPGDCEHGLLVWLLQDLGLGRKAA